jgi:hypothetical protein
MRRRSSSVPLHGVKTNGVMSNQCGDVHLSAIRFKSLEEFSYLENRAPTVAGNHGGNALADEVWRKESRILRHVAFDVCMDVDKTWRHSQTVSIDHGSGLHVVEITDASDSVIAYPQIAPKCWTA